MNEAGCCLVHSGQPTETRTKSDGAASDSTPSDSTYPGGAALFNGRPEYATAGAASFVDISKTDFGPFAPIRLSDKEKYNSLFRAINPQISDLTFSNLLMWRNMINFRAAWADGFACIIAVPRLYPPYAYAPAGDASGNPGGFERACAITRDVFEANGWQPRFRCVPIDVAPMVTRMFDSCECEEDRDFYDYLYLADDLINLRGKKFDGKRNHINKFKKLYEYEYEKLTTAHIDDCLRIMYDRCVDNGCDCLRGMEYACDRRPSAELLEHYAALDCKGALIKVGGRYEAFTIGEALNRDTAVIYIEKANVAIAGLYAFINQQFCEREWAGMTYINREEDEGVPGLRKAKLSYHPYRLIEKYTITGCARSRRRLFAAPQPAV